MVFSIFRRRNHPRNTSANPSEVPAPSTSHSETHSPEMSAMESNSSEAAMTEIPSPESRATGLRAGGLRATATEIRPPDENAYLANSEASIKLLADLLAENQDISVESRLTTLRNLIRYDFADIFVGKARFNAGHRSSVALQNALEKLENWLYFDGLSHRPILAVGGMFSAGKSQFLNAILKDAVLPVATTPTTAIPTYLMYGDTAQILALNSFNRRTVLDAEALKAISHAFHQRYHLGFSHLIRRIQITTPQMPYQNLVFLDTPGYSKPDALQKADNIDENLARKHLLMADYLLWLIDVEKGTLAQEDIQFLQSLSLSSPIFFVVNKADLKPRSQVEAIVEQVSQEAANAQLPTAGFCAYSSRNGVQIFGDDLLAYLQSLDGVNKYADPWGTFAQSLMPLREELDLHDNQVREALQMGNSLIIDHLQTPTEAKKALTDYVQNAKQFQKELADVRRSLTAFSEKLEQQVDSLAADLLAHRPPKLPAEMADQVRKTAYEADRHLQTDGATAAYLAPHVGFSLRDWRRAAETGMAEGQFLLGLCYGDGLGCEQNSLKAAEWFRYAADQGHAGAQKSLGDHYLQGYGVPQSDEMALIWYRKAADQNHADALYLLGEAHGMGRGVPPDADMAANYCRQAAERGHGKAQHKYGACCEQGYGAPQDDREAVKWYRRAAEQGYAEAQCYLGALYATGRLVAADPLEAAKWCRLAADQGHPHAQYMYGDFYIKGIGVPINDREAVDWYRKSAQQGYLQGQYQLAHCYLNGTGVAQNLSEGAHWFLQAAQQGCARSQFQYAELCEQGRGVSRNYQDAAHWYRKSADQGNTDAQNNLGNLYLQGLGVKKSPTDALVCFQKAADQGNAWGQYNLGFMYATDQGVPQDFDKARYWYERAAAQGHEYAQANLKRLPI